VDPTLGRYYRAGAKFKPGKWRVRATATDWVTFKVKSPYKKFTVYP